MKKITADYHLHSDVSPDCKTPMEESCEAAIQKGLTELTFTEHMEMFSGNFKRYPVSYMQQYFGNLARCREKFAGKLVLKAGVELGQGQLDREWEKTIIDLFPFDFIIGSVHKMDNVDMGKMAFADEAQTKRIIQLMPILRRLAERGKALEINTSGIRQSPKEALPSVQILKMFKEAGGRYLTVGSDAHLAKDVGADFDTARQMALEAGFRHIALYEQRKPILVSVED